MHNVVGTGTNFALNMAFDAPVGRFRFTSYCDTLFLFYKNHFYKNVEVEICPQI